ncbi:MAG: CHAT domain-containing protein [Sphaerospermopsis sp. SIO1G2]|nr:CHAT domain-containing protein [Sphaerospermopsis sp. SIO1G2]
MNTIDYHDFQILVDKNNNIRASSEQGDESGELRLETNQIQLTLPLIESRSTNTQLLKSLGSQLYQALFPTEIHGLFRATIAAAQTNNYNVRLRLVFDSPELASLPWEFLYDERTNTFLANNTQTVLSRYIDVPLQKREVKAADLPLKVLLVISSPTNLAQLDVTGEEKLIREALAKHIASGTIELDVIQDANIRNINQKLREKSYNIFHFIGHGVFENNKGQIALVDNDGKSKLLDDESFANFFLGNSNVGLVVLNSCQGATVSSHQAFAGTAPNLVRKGIPAVVAMQYSILDSTAKLFADEFYRTLALGWPVDAAIQTTRNAISMEVGLDQPDFATPVLYMQAKDGIIYEKKNEDIDILKVTNPVDNLVQQVRSRFYDDIKKSYDKMQLFCVSLLVNWGDLFVDVNIVELISSDRRLEIDDLWKDFIDGIQKYSSYRSFDRIALGNQQQRVSGLEVLDKNTNLMVLGKPGSGKTTYLQRIVTECNQGNLQPHRIPILIKLRYFVDDDDARKFEFNLKPYLTQKWKLDTTETELILNHGKALILLDGLDEVVGTDGREISKKIKQFSLNYPHNQLIVTCRTNRIEDDLYWKSLRFDFIEIADFNKQQINAFVEHYFSAVNSNKTEGHKKAKEFLHYFYLEENKNIRELAITPILLSLTCAVFHQNGKFYSKRSQLYKEGLELLLEQWDKSRKIDQDEIYRDLSRERKLELLSYLAVTKLEKPQYVLFEEEEIESYIAKFLGIRPQDSRVVLKAIESQHGLLIERANKVWSFSHLTFQEYLVAKSIITSYESEALDQILEELTLHIYDKHWREIFLLALEILNNDSDRLILVRFMKIKLNEILHNSNKIQQLLTWVNQKSSNIDQSRTPSDSKLGTSIRAFYCANTFDHALNLNRPSDYTGDSANALAETLNPNFSLTHIFTIALDCERKFNFDHNLVLDRALTGILTLAIDIKEKLSLDSNWPDTNLYISTLDSCFHDIVNNKVIFFKPNSNLETSLRNLKEELPNPDSPELLELWQDWTNKLRNSLIEYRDIGHIWQLDKDEIQKLQIYFEATKLLIECLEIIKKEEIKSQVEEMGANLLLPLDYT